MDAFNYGQIYYKVTNKDEIHNEFQYKTGLNVDTIPFNDDPTESCVKGGLYFTDLDHIIEFFNYGCWVREVKIPKDAKVIKDPDGNKWRADKIILGRRYSIEEYIKELWNPKKFNWNWSWCLAEYCSDYFELWWNPKKFNWSYSWCLAEYCSDQFKLWWKPEKFNWGWSGYLAKYCSEYFELWWDPKKFDWDYSWGLTEYCSEYFELWWDPKKFD
jgi:hypothetical protein